ncbi:LON peptidase substrate-binding domain-containing protein [Pontibacter sp. G13]|uniref:LON peptidase substrate-binding domain-containing protein n=1 Tax=Pontibacter sp. G13 TaxID=3074898 RepID=UPI002889FFC8|nr:LON peptidase substrate-binding domain-containing protein [Pontibacter sp. G13]WNJ16178.1 LON peptidase substrate-binding domain-containing protein [Pontibacter sp. G13]
MEGILPLFPLNLVVYPGEHLKLHVFEERYKQLAEECLRGDTTFGIPTVLNQEVASVATEVKIVSVEKRYGNGELDMTTQGIRRIQISQYFPVAPNRLYPGGATERLEEQMGYDPRLMAEVKALLKDFHHALGVQRSFDTEDPNGFSFQIGHHVGFNLQQEHRLLTLPSEHDRLLFIKDHLKQVIPIVMETERLKARAKMNGHYKNIIPPNV